MLPQNMLQLRKTKKSRSPRQQRLQKVSPAAERKAGQRSQTPTFPAVAPNDQRITDV